MQFQCINFLRASDAAGEAGEKGGGSVSVSVCAKKLKKTTDVTRNCCDLLGTRVTVNARSDEIFVTFYLDL